MTTLRPSAMISVCVNDPIRQEVIGLMGSKGLNRSWRIVERVKASIKTKIQVVRDALKWLRKYGLIYDYLGSNSKLGIPTKKSYGCNLLALTGLGREWYRLAFGRRAVSSEVGSLASRYGSVSHTVAVLEARDLLRRVGYKVGDGSVLMKGGAYDKFRPDLDVNVGGMEWAVEVRHKVCYKPEDEWEEMLGAEGSVGGVVILLSKEQLRRQLDILYEFWESWLREMPPTDILLTSLEGMQGDWEWQHICLNCSGEKYDCDVKGYLTLPCKQEDKGAGEGGR